MNVFNEYSAYYDLLNQDKNYSEEVSYVSDLIRNHTNNARSILNLGCGTGKHDFGFLEKGYSVTGVDLSPEMIEIANSQLANNKLSDKISFQIGDVRSIRLQEEFDAVVSLFHVVSYQISNEDIQKTFLTAVEHLAMDGIFIFDCWYGPGVLTDRPHIRKKILENENYHVERNSVPLMYPNENSVDVNFEIHIKNKKTDERSTIVEVHKLRYLFFPELELLLGNVGFEIIDSETWMSREPLSFSSWNATFICRRRTEKL